MEHCRNHMDEGAKILHLSCSHFGAISKCITGFIFDDQIATNTINESELFGLPDMAYHPTKAFQLPKKPFWQVKACDALSTEPVV